MIELQNILRKLNELIYVEKTFEDDEWLNVRVKAVLADLLWALGQRKRG